MPDSAPISRPFEPPTLSAADEALPLAPWNDPAVEWRCEQHPNEPFPHDDCVGPGEPYKDGTRLTDPTPSGVTITAAGPGVEPQDITEGVQTLYDLVIQSMDWGSGFLTIEDVEPIAKLAHVCGFKGVEEADKYIEDVHRRERELEEYRKKYGGSS